MDGSKPELIGEGVWHAGPKVGELPHGPGEILSDREYMVGKFVKGKIEGMAIVYEREQRLLMGRMVNGEFVFGIIQTQTVQWEGEIHNREMTGIGKMYVPGKTLTAGLFKAGELQSGALRGVTDKQPYRWVKSKVERDIPIEYGFYESKEHLAKGLIEEGRLIKGCYQDKAGMFLYCRKTGRKIKIRLAKHKKQVGLRETLGKFKLILLPKLI